jgi:hypothetical protein
MSAAILILVSDMPLDDVRSFEAFKGFWRDHLRVWATDIKTAGRHKTWSSYLQIKIEAWLRQSAIHS